jgi:hypothetical protein
VGAADEGTRCAVSFAGDAAGVDDNESGFTNRLLIEPGGSQVGADCFAVGASGSAAEVLDEETRHGTSLLKFA